MARTGENGAGRASDSERPVRVMHLITGTGVGGAETMLYKLLSATDRSRIDSTVCSMIEPGSTAERIRGLGIEVGTLRMKRGLPDVRAIFRLRRAIRQWRPDILQTWMYHADLLGGVVSKTFGHLPVVWNIRNSDLRPEASAWNTIQVARVCGMVSGWMPTRIICCAESSRMIHSGKGYCEPRMVVIPNGFDVQAYRRSEAARTVCSDRFGIPPEAPLISLAARYHPQKDHATFVAAAKLCADRVTDVRFALCGDDINATNDRLTSLVRDAGLGERTHLLGRLPAADIALLMSRSSVVTTSSSSGEAFPNVVGEGMACGSVCVVTDVGDSAYIVGETGIVVPPRSPEKLAEGWVKVLRMDPSTREGLGQAARHRVETNFSLPKVAAQYMELYLEIVNRNSRPQAFSAPRE